jgi:hypothetical protein
MTFRGFFHNFNPLKFVNIYVTEIETTTQAGVAFVCQTYDDFFRQMAQVRLISAAAWTRDHAIAELRRRATSAGECIT